MDELKLGMVGLDTSHCTAFAEILNDETSDYYMKDGRITRAFPGGSRDFSSSINRVEGFTGSMRDDYGVQIVNSPEEAAEHVDAVLLTSVDGRQHLEQFEKIAPFGKPVFVDKPFAVCAADAEKILELSARHDAPVFSCSILRYAEGIAGLGSEAGRITGCQVSGPVKILPDYPGFFWYGVHCAEILYSKMGPGCSEVNVDSAESADVITGIWQDGRAGVVFGYRLEGVSGWTCSVFGEKGVSAGKNSPEPPMYVPAMKEILKFFKTGVSPVSGEEMLEVVAFLEAANTARKAGTGVKMRG